MRETDEAALARLDARLRTYEESSGSVRGLSTNVCRNAFLRQLVDSTRRVRYVSTLKKRPLDPRRAEPNDVLFDPVRAAIIHERARRPEEACWLVFLFVHFGKHARAKWRYIVDVYGKLGARPMWTWDTVSTSPKEFREWLDENQRNLTRAGPRGFGNHRKYQSLSAVSSTGTGAAVETYIQWVARSGNHMNLFSQAGKACQQDPKRTFSCLYDAMSEVASFGRVAKFDYLAMIGKLGLAEIEPDRAYLSGTTGPLAGARLFYGGTKAAPLSAKVLESHLLELDRHMNVGMQAIEDALCNWQKHPAVYAPFRA